MPRGQAVFKSQGEIEAMKQAGAIVAEVLDTVARHVRPGVSTLELDQIAEELMNARGATSAFKGYPHDRGGAPFSGVLCTSINEAVVHGLPKATNLLTEGDVVSVDFGCKFDGFYGDSARTIAVGEVSQEVSILMDVTRRALEAAIAVCRPDRRMFEIGAAVERIVRPHGFGIVTDFVGHGIGRELHEDPQVPNYVPHGQKARGGMILRPGLVLAIEPMVNLGTHRTRRHEDGWTIVTGDGKTSVHFEHTVAITVDGPIVLTSSN